MFLAVIGIFLAALLVPLAIYDLRSRARGRRPLDPAQMQRELNERGHGGRPEAYPYIGDHGA